MKARARRELSRNWPVIGIAVVMWLAVVILRTPALGLDVVRAVSILVSSTAMLVLGVMVERIRNLNEDKEDGQ